MKRFLKMLGLALFIAVACFLCYLPWYHVDLPVAFDFHPERASLHASILQFKHECKVEVEEDPTFRTRLKLHFVRGDRKILSFDAHPKTVFCCSGDTLYFAHFQTCGPGCVIAAYDLSWGWRLWRTELGAVGPPEVYSMYDNNVTLTLTEKTLVVSGCEAYGDYVEILDRRTGISMGHKIYREGFHPAKEGQVPFIGGPIKR